MSTKAAPFIKWAGGKGALVEQICELLPADMSNRTYREPFLGGGAVYFHLMSTKPPFIRVLSDTSPDLVNAYRMVQTMPSVVLNELRRLKRDHSDEVYYDIRNRYNSSIGLSLTTRAAWFIYLNKTCYNGLWRTNKKGEFNTPVGRSKSPPAICDEGAIQDASIALAGTDIHHLDFRHLPHEAYGPTKHRPGDVIYMDPPYVPASKTSNFTGYAGGFTMADQADLARLFGELDERGCCVLLSNSDTPEVRKLYDGFEIHRVEVNRAINSNGGKRGKVGELLIRGRSR